MEDSKGDDQTKIQSNSSAQFLNSLEESSWCFIRNTALREMVGVLSLGSLVALRAFPSAVLGAPSLFVISFSFYLSAGPLIL